MKKILLATIPILVPATAIATDGVKELRPNILFCLADDVTFSYIGAYGCKWVKTPNMDKAAREGMLFSHAYTSNAKSGPSRSSILTGRYSWQLDEAANHFAFFPQKFITFPETLSENGYNVGMTGKGWAPGDPGSKEGKVRQLIGKSYENRKLVPLTKGISTNDYTANFVDFLQSNDQSKPFFFWFGSLESHRNYEYGTGVAKGGYKTMDIDRIPPFWPDNDITRNDMLDFALELEHFDKHVGQMIELLRKKNLLDNTIVVITADNGMAFPRIKGQAYEASNHLPLIVMWPKAMKEKGMVNNDFINFADFAPTFIDAAQILTHKTKMQPMEGQSFLSILKNEKNKAISDRTFTLIGKERHDIGRPDDQGYPIRGIVTKDYLYIHNFETSRWPAGNPETGYLNCDGGAIKSDILANQFDKKGKWYWSLNFGKRPSDELYDLRNDLDCINNLAAEADYASILSQFKNQMLDELKKQGDPRIISDGCIFDRYVYSDKLNRNYYNNVIKERKKTPTPAWIEPTDIDNSHLND